MRFLAAPSHPNDETDLSSLERDRDDKQTHHTLSMLVPWFIKAASMVACYYVEAEASVFESMTTRRKIQEREISHQSCGLSMDGVGGGKRNDVGTQICIGLYKYEYMECSLLTGSIAIKITNKVRKFGGIWANRKRARANSGKRNRMTDGIKRPRKGWTALPNPFSFRKPNNNWNTMVCILAVMCIV